MSEKSQSEVLSRAEATTAPLPLSGAPSEFNCPICGAPSLGKIKCVVCGTDFATIPAIELKPIIPDEPEKKKAEKPRGLAQFWPDVNGKAGAERASYYGFLGCLGYALWILIPVFTRPQSEPAAVVPFSLIAAAFITLGLMVWKKVRIAAVLAPVLFAGVLFIQDRLRAAELPGQRTWLILAMIGLCFVHGIRGAFAPREIAE
jgi:hypothetical protein